MSEMSTFDRVKNVIVEHLQVEPEKVTPHAYFIDDLGADSLDIVELIMATEEEFGKEIPDDDAERLATVGEVVAYLDTEGENLKSLSAPGWDDSRGPQMSDVVGRTIFKYQMPVLEQFSMDLPEGAHILRVDDEGGMFWLWAIVDTRLRTETRKFRAFKTGAAMPEADDVALRYIGFCKIFVQMELGLYIFEELQ